MKEMLFALVLGIALPGAWAQKTPTDNAALHPTGVETGEVRRIDKEQGKVTLRHGELKTVQMPPMTMAFAVSDPKQLDALKVGDRVAFKVIKKPDGAILVTEIKRAQ